MHGDSVASPYEAFQQQELQQLATVAAEHASVNQIAAETGGKAFYNSNAIADAIATATEQGSNYYTLSYNPDNKNYDGRFRKIKVAFAEKGYHLYYRPGYFADDLSSPSKDREVAHNIRAVAMQRGSPLSHQIRFSAVVAPVGTQVAVDRAKIGEVLLASAKKDPVLPPEVIVQPHSIDYVIDSSGLRFTPLDNGTFRSALTLMVASFDAEGRPLTDILAISESDLQPAAYKEVLNGGLHLHQDVDIPPKAKSLRIGVQDQFSNFVGTVDVSLPVPPAPDLPRLLKNSLPEIEPQ